MKFWCVVVLCSLRIVFGCEVDDRIIQCAGYNLTEIPTFDFINSSEIISEVKILNLSVNALSSPVNFSSWSQVRIESLDISYNKFSFIDNDTFVVLKYLKVLNISNNALFRMNLAWSQLPTIEVLDLSYNPELRGSLNIFNDLSKSRIAHLNLSFTNTSLPSYDVFSKVTTLLKLDLSKNGLMYIPDLPANLEYLDFSDNSIVHVDPDCFDRDTKLKTLLLERNRNLHEIRYESFNFLLELKRLSFEGCSDLSHLPTSLFFYNKKLEYLSLVNCNFRNISVAFKSSFLHMKHIGLEGNPWHCSPHIKWFVQLHDHHIISDDIRSVFYFI